MNIKTVVAKQYRENVNRARAQVANLFVPAEGWIRAMRSALGMSGSQLAKRIGVTKSLIYNTEKAELTGGVTIKTMRQMAEALGCRFVYAIVPEKDIEEVVKKRAREKAHAQVEEASIHMALEDQVLSRDKLEAEIERLATEMLDKGSSDLWNDE